MGGGNSSRPEHTTQEALVIQRNTSHTREVPSRIAFYCHFCCYHTYDVTRNTEQYNNVRFCSTRDCLSGQRVPMEVIFLTPEGNQRLRQIIAQFRETSHSSASSAPIAMIPLFERVPTRSPFRPSSVIHGGVKLGGSSVLTLSQPHPTLTLPLT